MEYIRPGHGLRAANWLVKKLRFKPTLAVVGRRSGKLRTVPVNVLEHQGKRYLVSPRGETEWVRNLRAAGTAQISTQGGSQEVTAVEVPDSAKEELIAAYRQRWDRETRRFWEALPDPADHPIFELT